MYYRRFLTLSAVATLAACSSADNTSQGGATSSQSDSIVAMQGSGCVPLIANQNINAGQVCASVSGGDVKVTYDTTGTWKMTDARLWAGLNLADMPQDANHDPIISQMPYQSGPLNYVTHHEFLVPLSVFGLSADMTSCNPTLIYLVPKAAMIDANSTFAIAWGGDKLMGTWSRYFTETLTCSGTPDAGTGSCETAFAYGADKAECFIGMTTQRITIQRWGWTNGPLGEGNYSFDIYRGAGQCDLTKGERVGTLTVEYHNGEADICYNAAAGASFSETHLYVGSQPLPKDKKGVYTVAPGQYPYSHDLSGAVQDCFHVTGLSGNIYVIAHSEACGTPSLFTPPADMPK